VCLIGGDIIVLEPPVTLIDSIDELRRRSAQHLDIHPSMLALLHDGAELLDGSSLDHCVDAGNTVITAVIQPCRAKPEEYESYILPCKECLQDDPAASRQFLHEDLVESGPGRAFMKLRPVRFPKPTGININMMPFIIGKKESIPKEYQTYWPLIEECSGLSSLEWRPNESSIGYLTIQEGNVRQGQTQRRAGLHVETPGSIKKAFAYCNIRAHWGCGDVNGHDIHGGLYMASSVAGSCKIWNARLRDPENIVGHLGNIEHLRDLLGEGCQLEAGELIWLTDTTPHEALPVEEDCYRQFFRVVSCTVSVWYENHSTKNRLGIVPDPSITTIITGDKFEHAEGDNGSKDDGDENDEGNNIKNRCSLGSAKCQLM